jgi:SAM-dependent methyltransferase
MNWRTKARIANCVAKLPFSLSYGAYYCLQRCFGRLRDTNPTFTLGQAARIAEVAASLQKSLVKSTCFELGTGRNVDVPLALWLLGAEKIITVDLNPYLKETFVRADLEYIKNHSGEVRELFAGRIDDLRLEALLSLAGKKWRLPDLLELCRITYLAPCDASNTLPIPSDSVDFYVSVVVLQHIPADVLRAIFVEGNRVVKRGGLFLHKIDHTDHFSHTDPAISSINFLQFEDDEWAKYAANRFMYVNRLRQDDYLEIFRAAGQKVLLCDAAVDLRARELLQKNGLKLAERFAGKPKDVLEISSSWIVSEKSCESSLSATS